MRHRLAPRAALRVAAASTALAVAAWPAHAGSLTVRDGDGSAWTVAEDPNDGANDFLLTHLVAGGSSDPRFGRNGQAAFTLGPVNDPPASVRVDATHRIWMVGASLAANQPQPVIARFLADGGPDLRWGVQGKVQITPNGVAVKPNDLLPLADGSVLVAGEATAQAAPRAVVFHLKADGSLDRAFGSGGLWQRADAADASTATSLAAGTDGTAAVAVAVRGAKPAAELWAMTDDAPGLIVSKPLDDTTDGEDLRVTWGPGWNLVPSTGATGVVPAALLSNRPALVAVPGVTAAASDPGAGGLSPFASEAASAPEAANDDGMPWGWISGGVAAIAAGVVAFVLRKRRAGPALRSPSRR
jgi:hypothetical protein